MSDSFTNRFFKDLSLTSFGMGVAMLIDFIFFILVGRLLGPEKFGLFGVFLSLYYVLVKAPFSSLEMTAKKIEVDTGEAINQLGSKTLKLGIIATGILLVASPVITRLLELPYPAYLVFLLTFPLAYVTSVLMSVVQARERFKLYAVYESLSSVAKFSALIVVLAGFGLSGAVSAHALEIIAGFVILYLVLRPNFSDKAFKARDILFNSFIFIAGINAAFSIDIILLKLFNTAETVGLYNTVAVLGKGLFFASIALNRSVFPKFADGEDNPKLLKMSLAVLVLQGTAAVLFFYMFGEMFIGLTFGEDFIGAAGFAPLYMLFISLVSGCGLLGNYYLSRGRKEAKIVALLPIIQVFLILVLPVTVINVILAGITASVLVFALMLLPLLKELYIQT